MAITPQQALDSSPAAKLDEDEREKVNRGDAEIIAGLASWPGGPFQAKITATARVINALSRRWQMKGWQVGLYPLDGAMGKADELIAAGAALDWTFVLAPEWGRAPVSAKN